MTDRVIFPTPEQWQEMKQKKTKEKKEKKQHISPGRPKEEPTKMVRVRISLLQVLESRKINNETISETITRLIK